MVHSMDGRPICVARGAMLPPEGPLECPMRAGAAEDRLPWPHDLPPPGGRDTARRHRPTRRCRQPRGAGQACVPPCHPICKAGSLCTPNTTILILHACSVANRAVHPLLLLLACRHSRSPLDPSRVERGSDRPPPTPGTHPSTPSPVPDPCPYGSGGGGRTPYTTTPTASPAEDQRWAPTTQ